MRSAVLALAVVSVAGPALATEGRVVGPDDQPIARAEVSILGHTGTALTDEDGRFTWTPDPHPPFDVLVVLPGGGLLRPMHVAALPAEGPLVIRAVAAIEETVTVTGGAAPHLAPPPAAGTAMLDAEELERRSPTHLTEALENVAGVSKTSEGQAAVPTVRGLARGRTLILIDGARVTSERRVGPSATYLDPAVLESVEVSRGPGGVAWGSDAFGGVIDARTRRAQPGAGWGGRVAADLGAGIPQQRAAVEVSRGFAQGGILVQGHYRNQDAYTSPEGEIHNYAAEDYGLRARLDQPLGPGLFTLSGQGDFGRDIERPRTNSRSARFFYPTEDSYRFVASWEAPSVAGFSRIGGSAFFSRYALVGDTDNVATDEEPRFVERSDVASDDFHLRAFAVRPVRGTRLELGLDVNGRRGLEALDITRVFDAAGAVIDEAVSVSVDDARRLDAALYASAQRALGTRATLDAGLRGDRVTTRNQGGYFGDRDTAEGAGSGFLGLSVRPAGGLSVSAQAARGFRDPVLSDRYYRGPTGRGFITGNPDLVPETSLQFDLAVRYTAPRWRAALLGFDYRIDDLVERFETDEDFFFFRNRGEARLRGVEAEAAVEVAHFSAELSAHIIRGRAVDDDAPLDDVPPPTVSLRVARQLGPAYVQARFIHYFEDDRPGPTEQPRPPYSLVDLGGGYRVSTAFEVRALVRNLLDESYPASPDRRAVLAPGRSLLVSAVVDF